MAILDLQGLQAAEAGGIRFGGGGNSGSSKHCNNNGGGGCGCGSNASLLLCSGGIL